MYRAIIFSGTLLIICMALGGPGLHAQERNKVLPSVAQRNVSRELQAYIERFSKDKSRDKEEINAKWAEIARKHAATVQTEGLSDAERKRLAELYGAAKMYAHAIAVYSEIAAGSDFEARNAARAILDLQIEEGTMTLGELRAALNAYRERFPPDAKDMLGLFSQVYKLAHITNGAGYPDSAINLVQDEINHLSTDHPYYNWRLAIEAMPFYKAAGRLEEGLALLLKYEADFNKVVETRNADRPEDTKAAAEFDRMTKRFADVARSMRFAYRRESLVGQEAPNFTFTHFFNSDPIQYADLRGKIIVIDFWATWCLPCLETFPKMRDLYATYKDMGVQFIGVTGFQGRMSNHGSSPVANISPDKELSLMPRYIKHQQITWPIAFSTRNCYDEAYGIDAIPRVIVIDQKGILRLMTHSARTEEIISMVEKLLAEND